MPIANVRPKRMPVGSVESVCDSCGASTEGRIAIIKRTTSHGRRHMCLKCAARCKLGYYRPELKDSLKEAHIYFVDRNERIEWEAMFEVPAHELAVEMEEAEVEEKNGSPQ